VLPSISPDLARVGCNLNQIANDETAGLTLREDLLAMRRVVALLERSWGQMLPKGYSLEPTSSRWNTTGSGEGLSPSPGYGGQWGQMNIPLLPYLVQENLRLQALLGALTALLPQALQVNCIGGPPTEAELLESEVLGQTNAVLRSAPSQLISASLAAEPTVAAEITRLTASTLRLGLSSRPW